MPPLKGIPRGLNSEALTVLEESGHGNQIIIVDPSYPIPRGALVINYVGDPNTSDGALDDILTVLPIEGPVTAMLPDEGETCDANEAFEAVTLRQRGGQDWAMRLDDQDPEHPKGFYSQANDPEKQTIFFKTRDKKAFACAMFIVGHSQE
jgi:L-fucose mutarotase/ribose pyranase (RbsD/FucU family)